MTDHEQQKNDPAGTVRELFVAAMSVLVGLVLASVVLTALVIPKLGFPGDLARIMKLGDRLERSPSDARLIEIVGNSVGVEGIAASMVQSELPEGFVVENQASNGLDLLSARVYIGRLLESEPDVLVWLLRPELMGEIKGINDEVASAMRFMHYDRDEPWIRDPSLTSLDDGGRDRLTAGVLSNRKSLRTLPIRHLNSTVRTKLRAGILPAQPMNVDAPFQMDVNLEGPRLERHIADVSEAYEDRAGSGNLDGLAFIEQTVEQIQQAGVRPILVIAPTHPGAAVFEQADAAFAAHLSELSARTGVEVIDLSGTLSESDFADAIHPNREGAHRLSTLLGDALARSISAEKNGA